MSASVKKSLKKLPIGGASLVSPSNKPQTPADALEALKSPQFVAASNALAQTRKSISSSKLKSSNNSSAAMMEDFMESANASKAAQSIVEQIVQRGFDLIHSHYVAREAMELAARDGVHAIMQTIEWTLIEHDQGEFKKSENNDNENEEVSPVGRSEVWCSESEPAPIAIDRWARGALTVKAANFNNIHGIEKLNEDKHRIDETSRSTNRSRNSTHRLSIHKLKDSESGLTADESKEVVKRPVPINEPMSPAALAAESQRIRELRKLFAIRKAAAEKASAKQSEADEIAKFATIASELKGKNYTFDSQNNVVVISAAKVENLPAFQLKPKFEIRDGEEDNEDLTANTRENRIKRRKRAELLAKRAQEARDAGIVLIDPEEKLNAARRIAEAKMNSPKNKSQRNKDKPAAKKTDNGFIDLSLVQPSLFHSMVLVPGAVIRQGAQMKAHDTKLGTAAGTVEIDKINSTNAGGSAFDSVDRGLLTKMTRTQFNDLLEKVREKGNAIKLQTIRIEENNNEEEIKEIENQKEIQMELDKQMMEKQLELEKNKQIKELEAQSNQPIDSFTSSLYDSTANRFSHTSESLSPKFSRSANMGNSRRPRDRMIVPSHQLNHRISQQPKQRIPAPPSPAKPKPKPFERIAVPSVIKVTEKNKFYFSSQGEFNQ